MLSKENRERIQTEFYSRIGKLVGAEPKEYSWQTLDKLLLFDMMDRYVEHRIETDKVLLGILKDIQNNTETLSQTMECINNVGIVCHESMHNQKGVQSMSRDQNKSGSGVVSKEPKQGYSGTGPAPQLDQEPAAPAAAPVPEPAAPAAAPVPEPAAPAAAPVPDPAGPAETPETPDAGSGES